MNILIIGHARHGKDTVAQMISDTYGLSFNSSSMACAEIFIYDELKEKYGYQTFEECYEDRMNHRAEWYDMICEYNKDDKARLAKEIMKTNDMYVGMRDHREIKECINQGVFDLIIGVFDPRKPLENPDSFNIDIWEASDVVIPNAQGLDELRVRVAKLLNDKMLVKERQDSLNSYLSKELEMYMDLKTEVRNDLKSSLGVNESFQGPTDL